MLMANALANEGGYNMVIRKLNPYEAQKILTISEAADVYMMSFLDIWEKEEGGDKEYSLVYEDYKFRYTVIKSWCNASELSMFLATYVETD